MVTEEERERIRFGHQMEALLKTDEWKAFAGFIQARGNQVFQTLTPPLKTWDAVLEQEYQKGTLRGIELTMETPARIVAEMHQLIDAIDAEEVESSKNG